MEKKKKLLVIEDSPEFQMMFRSVLAPNYDITIVGTGSEALSLISSADFALFIVDVMLPDMSGLQICSYIKSQEHLAQIPTIIVSGRDTPGDKVEGLDMGADDYIAKPFDFSEFQARIRSHLRRSQQGSHLIELPQIKIDLDRQSVVSVPSMEEIELTRIEFKLLTCFAQRIEFVLSRQQILDIVWPDSLNVSERTIDSHISNLRRKIAGCGVDISSVHGSGYRCKIDNKAA